MTPKFSVFTPSNASQYLDDAYQSLLAQDFEDWEWVILLNGDASLETAFTDSRVKVCMNDEPGGIGHFKKEAVSLCTGEILVELDHDDLLESTCLSELLRAFNDHPEASLVYSQFTEVNEDLTPRITMFNLDHGWEYSTIPGGFITPGSLEPTPHNVSLIWYAPNHVRAFRREFYDKAGGYDATLDILDDQDLMSRLYQIGPFVSIDKVLYRQRFHSANNQTDVVKNARIQEETWDLYEKYLFKNALAWTANKELQTASSIEQVVYDEEADEDFGVIRLVDEIKVGDNVEELLQIFHERLVPNGLLLTMQPEDKYVNEHFFRAFATSDQALFQVSRLRTFDFEGKKWVQANLICVKPGYTREGGYLFNTTLG